MDFYVCALSDIGLQKEVNQDCVFAERFDTPIGLIAFAILCDGMGGLEHGEIASSLIVSAFATWARETLPALTGSPIEDYVIRSQWTQLIVLLNQQIQEYGLRGGFTIGSTVTALLMTQERYFVLNIGDSRAYEIGASVRQLTEDHTVIANEVRLGNLTPEQAESAPMKNVLTKCVGVEDRVYPDLFFGAPQENAIYMLCSDGFRHCVSTEELRAFLLPENNAGPEQMEANIRALIELNKQRGETDNISAITVCVR